MHNASTAPTNNKSHRSARHARPRRHMNAARTADSGTSPPVSSSPLWGLAAVVFPAVNIAFSAGLALVVAIVVVLGGMTTSAVAYLITERLLRPVRRPNGWSRG